ncbi:type I-U CRISPR-associated RAMP protein Csb1/Cas7u [Methylomonas sp. SURF-2]|uniref:Type I-U CRISPR-associated RAMP protein Csb1/Cas7u n=1 Tax=Methylomonas subterranea TaxID=2952225 RepID=A0ABT1TLA3_9GAMM|nr:type I-U CRISPR-associated RAMP protein Csb1/Cas7u [Methylomonas sp. SURF-2]MCQ8106238.1 type I-U CRISPR-associated RAMP protein Csb1/Cas7u [Methylomonas sp. SURF-2]
MTQTLTLDIIKQAVSSHAAAFRCITEYQPMGGLGDKVFPPTYEGGKYATEKRVDAETGELVDCVLLDSVQSQANRSELALLEVWRTKDSDGKRRIQLPIISTEFIFNDPQYKSFSVTSLEAPHRVADAIFRDSNILSSPNIKFRDSAHGKALNNADTRNASDLFAICPTALIFGIWDSTGPRGGLGAKFQRALVSEMVGWGVVDGINVESRIDSAGIVRASGPIFRTEDDSWTTNPDLAKRVGNKLALYGLSKGNLVAYDENKDQDQGAPSKINHGNIVPNFSYAKDSNNNIVLDDVVLENGKVIKKPRIKGGFTIKKAIQTTVLSLVALRRLRFPINGAVESDNKVDIAARTVLTTLGLLAATLQREQGADLRSRCQLFPQQAFVWELLDVPTEEPKQYVLTGNTAVELFNQAVKEATALGLPWEDEIKLQPSEDLLALVRKSQEANMHQSAEGGE